MVSKRRLFEPRLFGDYEPVSKRYVHEDVLSCAESGDTVRPNKE